MRIENTIPRRGGSLMTIVAAAALAATATLSAQPDMSPCPWNTTTIISGATYRVAGNHHSLAFAPSKYGVNHTTWSLFHHGNSSRLFLRVSMDGGCTDFLGTSWALRTSNQTGGFMVMGNDCRTLHVLFEGKNAAGYSTVYYDAWDTATIGWIGLGPQVIADGTSTNYQYGAQDIEVTAKGRVVISYYCVAPGDSSQPWFTSWYSAIVRVAQPPADLTQAGPFGSGYPVNANPQEAFGVNLHAVGERVHVVFHSQGSRIHYRGFDANGEQWNTPTNVTVATQADQAAVVGSITTDDDCAQCDYKIYILFASRYGGSGNLWISCAANALSPSFTTCLVDSDAPIQAGQNWNHFTLANGPNREITAVYSKASEFLRNLYAKRYVNGITCAETRCDVELTTTPERFRAVIGSRSSLVTSSPYVMVGGLSTVKLYREANTARTVNFNRYIGTRPSVPRLTATNTPTISGPPFCFGVSDVPPAMPGVLYIGLQCVPEFALPSPFDPGSFLKQDLLAAIPYTTISCGGGGHWQMCLSIPSSVLKGQSVYFQAFQFYSFSPVQVVPSNSMAAIFDL